MYLINTPQHSNKTEIPISKNSTVISTKKIVKKIQNLCIVAYKRTELQHIKRATLTLNKFTTVVKCTCEGYDRNCNHFKGNNW